MEKKRAIILTIIAVAIMLVCIVSATYAYFIASVEGTGNTTNNQESVTAVEIGSIYYDGVTTYNGTKIYPGMKAIQEFKIGPNSTSGTGTYEIDLEGTVPSAFGSDILVKLYKTTDKSNNNLVRTEGALVQSGNQFYKEDTIIVNGTPELVYEDVLSNNQSAASLELFLARLVNNSNYAKTLAYSVTSSGTSREDEDFSIAKGENTPTNTGGGGDA